MARSSPLAVHTDFAAGVDVEGVVGMLAAGSGKGRHSVFEQLERGQHCL